MSISLVRPAQRTLNALPRSLCIESSKTLHQRRQRAKHVYIHFRPASNTRSTYQTLRLPKRSKADSLAITKNARRHSSTKSSEPTPKLKYTAAAAYSAKNHYYRSHYHWNYGSEDSSNFRFPAGQDAFFVAGFKDSTSIALGVADGVGGWSDSNIDSAIFARSLCDNMAQTVGSSAGEFSIENNNSQDLLKVGYNAVMRDPNVIGGGSTACVAIAHGNSSVNIANLGDSGFVHMRLNAIRFGSEAQQHTFNAPFQLSKLPPQLRRQALLFGGQMYSEQPTQAQITNLVAQHGDVFIFATDGLWDNLTFENILEITNKIMIANDAWKETEDGMAVADNLPKFQSGVPDKTPSKTIEAALASAIVREAKMASLDRRRDSPFARRSRKENPYYSWYGGKIDDICVVVLLVRRA